MTVLALDLSLTATGHCSSDGAIGTIIPKTKGTARIVFIVDEVLDEVHRSKPKLIIMEDIPFGGRNNAAGPLAMLHGALRYMLHDRGCPFVTVPPASLKKYATGKGNATKPDMRMALFQRHGLDLRDDNQVDAWWLMHMALDHLGEPIIVLPKTHRDALAKVEWE